MTAVRGLHAPYGGGITQFFQQDMGGALQIDAPQHSAVSKDAADEKPFAIYRPIHPHKPVVTIQALYIDFPRWSAIERKNLNSSVSFFVFDYGDASAIR